MRALSVALVLFGWLGFAAVIATRLLLNHATGAEGVAPQKPPGSVYLREDFVDGVSDDGWREPPVSHVGATCLYPGAASATHAGLLILSVEQRLSACAGALRPYRGAVLQTRQRFVPPFRVIARARAAGSPGAVSAIFTYTDPFDGTPHFENDIEFPSEASTRESVWLNQFGPWTPPAHGDETFVPLGFDAVAAFHIYEIDVYPEATVWKVDGRVVRRTKNFAPAPPQSVNVNAWWKGLWPGVYTAPPVFSARDRRFFLDWLEVDAIAPDVVHGGPP